ncbi:MAG TPA: hypothetical protein PKA00_01315 [Saprospiraceae bacterium]|nr:hypothetical protein [Saprospiraceae bacterium]HMQ81507.1 hypothetical protein [Saprospiraceae bacterium]
MKNQNKLLKIFIGKKLAITSALFLGAFWLLVTATTNEDAVAPCNCGTLINIEFGADVPGDNKLITGQTQADCFAWSEFVALNWPIDPQESFGQPGSTGLVQWETYMNREVLMAKDGSPPPPWGDDQKAPDHLMAFAKNAPSGVKVLFHQSKFNTESLDETGQAAPENAPNWLGAQNGTNLWYEVLVNKDEYDFIVKNGFYNADSQYNYVKDGKVIDFPRGNSSGRVGAIELKASWMEVPDPDDPKWNRYKLSEAWLIDPGSSTGRAATVALIGLHILHKTESQPTWLWATFEHIDNVPGSNPKADSYNLYSDNPQAHQVNVPGNCGKNPNKTAKIYTIDTIANQPPSYYLCNGAGPVSMQVRRVIPIDTDAKAVNKLVQNYIAKNFPGSVWANYQLVNMVWSTTPQNNQNNQVPQGVKSMQPLIPVANAASETFIQTATCLDCHQFAPIALSSKQPESTNFAANFSFVLEFAGYQGKKD